MFRPAMLFTIALLGISAFAADEAGAAWAKVERLRPGQIIRVLRTDRQTWTGRLTEVSADAIALETGGTERKVARPEVRRIQVRSRANSALTGLAIGAAAGVGIGYAAGSGSGLKSGETGAAVALGAGLFAAAGAGVGSLFPGWKTVYAEAPTSSRSQYLCLSIPNQDHACVFYPIVSASARSLHTW